MRKIILKIKLKVILLRILRIIVGIIAFVAFGWIFLETATAQMVHEIPDTTFIKSCLVVGIPAGIVLLFLSRGLQKRLAEMHELEEVYYSEILSKNL